MDDLRLLRDYASHRCEQAFACLVQRHMDLVRSVVTPLGERATLHVVEAADHSFHVLVRSGRNDAQVREELLDTMAAWIAAR